MGKMRWTLCLLPVAFASGCVGFWDEVTSRNRDWGFVFSSPDPMMVLRDSDDGGRRAWALARLEEPLQNGGKQEDQDVYVAILTKTAVQDRDPLCRLAAIKTLGRYRDDRVPPCLRSVTEQQLPYTSDMNNLLRQEALKALAETNSEVAMRHLIRVAKEPPAEGSAYDRQEVLDRRLTACRGLAKYNHPDAAEALYQVLQGERDIGLRARAHQSLVASTGKNLPPDPQTWARHLHPEQAGSDPFARDDRGPGVMDILMFPIRQVRGWID
jgi:hypothetical protein